MRFIILIIAVSLNLPVWGQPGNFSDRKLELEKCTENVYSIKEFQQIADSLQMSISELSDYPVISPVKKTIVSSGFGMRYHPIYRVRKFHTGIDISGSKGTPVYATGNGIVVQKGYCSGYGNFIEIQHTGGFRSFYAHLNRTLVNVGDPVGMGKHIAYVGNTGLSTGYHLHYEIRKGNYFLNPLGWCSCLLEVLKNRDYLQSQSKTLLLKPQSDNLHKCL